MNVKRAYVHIGAHKTASSYLQDHLRKNRKALRSEDISVMFTTGEFESNFMPSYKSMIWESIESSKFDMSAPSSQTAIEVLGGVVRGVKTGSFVFSDERLLGPMLGYTKSLYPGAEYAAKFLSTVLADIEVVIVLYIRNQSEFIESAFLQHFRENGPKKDFSAFLAEIEIEGLSWLPVVRSFVDAFGAESLVVRSYEDINRGEQEFVNRFFETFTTLRDIVAQDVVVNPRFSLKAMEVFELAFPLLSSAEAHRFQGYLKQAFPVGEYAPPTLLSQEVKRKIDRLYSDQNIAILGKDSERV